MWVRCGGVLGAVYVRARLESGREEAVDVVFAVRGGIWMSEVARWM